MTSETDARTTDPERDAHLEWSRSAKRALRQKLRALRQALPEQAAQARSARVVERLLLDPRVVAASGVGLFWPILERREIDLRQLDALLRARGTRLYYPFLSRINASEVETGFRLVTAAAELVPRGQHFAEPPPTAPIARRGDIDVVIVPALAATPDGHRLGYGSGFYDATLADLCPPATSIVVVHDFQLMLELPTEAHDFVCGVVITDGRMP